MQATTLSEYLLYTSDKKFLSSDVGNDGQPSRGAEWRVTPSGDAFTLTNNASGDNLSVAGSSVGTGGADDLFMFVDGTKCSTYPEPEVNVSGTPGKGLPRNGEVTGTVEAHMHHMAFRFLGGRPLRPALAPLRRRLRARRLSRPPGRRLRGAVLENASTARRRPLPRPDRLARVHRLAGTALADPRAVLLQVARALMAQSGLRVFVNLMVQNRVALRDLSAQAQEPGVQRLRQRSSIELKRGLRAPGLHRRPGGRPRQGLVPDRQEPVRGAQGDQRRQARRDPRDGGLRALRLPHVEGRADLRQKQITHRDPARSTSCGVRQMEITNKFDNALTGVAGDDGSTGVLVNSGNFYATGRFWDLETLPARSRRARPRRRPGSRSTTRT